MSSLAEWTQLRKESLILNISQQKLQKLKSREKKDKKKKKPTAEQNTQEQRKNYKKHNILIMGIPKGAENWKERKNI